MISERKRLDGLQVAMPGVEASLVSAIEAVGVGPGAEKLE
jgi:hypothetical protein